jgi:hypothetical protein
MQRELETPLARRIVRGEVRDGMHVLVDVVSDGLVFKAAEATVAAREEGNSENGNDQQQRGRHIRTDTE